MEPYTFLGKASGWRPVIFETNTRPGHLGAETQHYGSRASLLPPSLLNGFRIHNYQIQFMSFSHLQVLQSHCANVRSIRRSSICQMTKLLLKSNAVIKWRNLRMRWRRSIRFMTYPQAVAVTHKKMVSRVSVLRKNRLYRCWTVAQRLFFPFKSPCELLNLFLPNSSLEQIFSPGIENAFLSEPSSTRLRTTALSLIHGMYGYLTMGQCVWVPNIMHIPPIHFRRTYAFKDIPITAIIIIKMFMECLPDPICSDHLETQWMFVVKLRIKLIV